MACSRQRLDFHALPAYSARKAVTDVRLSGTFPGKPGLFFCIPISLLKVFVMSTPISVQGYKKLEQELEALKKERPAVIQAIKDAREEGFSKIAQDFENIAKIEKTHAQKFEYFAELLEKGITLVDKREGTEFIINK